jgi:hypothetical protein
MRSPWLWLWVYLTFVLVVVVSAALERLPFQLFR